MCNHPYKEMSTIGPGDVANVTGRMWWKRKGTSIYDGRCEPGESMGYIDSILNYAATPWQTIN